MAPRGRPRRVGLKRMDAAIDALSPMGFSPDLIRQKVKDLLQIYGGDEAWPIIEEGYYKLLIESILEDQEVEHNVQLDGQIAQEGSPSNTMAQGGVLPELSEVEPLLSPKTVRELPSLPHDNENKITASVEENKMHDTIGAQGKMEALRGDCTHSTPPGFEHLPLQGCVPRKRNPCLGWIGPKNDDDFVLLNPYPVQGVERRRKHKSRWDEKPDFAI